MGGCCVTQEAQLGAVWWPRRVGWRWFDRGSRERGTCILVCDSHYYTIKLTILQRKQLCANKKYIYVKFSAKVNMWFQIWIWVIKKNKRNQLVISSLIVHVCVYSVIQLCLTLWNFINCSPPSSSVHAILQAGIQEWVAISSSRGSSQLRESNQCFLHLLPLLH